MTLIKRTLYKVSGDINIFCCQVIFLYRKKNIDSKEVNMSSKKVPFQGNRNREGTITSDDVTEIETKTSPLITTYLPPKIYRSSYGPALYVPTYLIVLMYSSLNIC